MRLAVLVVLLLGGAACQTRGEQFSEAGPGDGGVVSSVGPCTGRVQDQLPHPMPPLSKPRPGETYIDPAFGTRVTRITSVDPAEGENAIIKPMYSTVPAWNADGSLILLWHRGGGLRYELYQGDVPYAHIRTLREWAWNPSDIEHILWDPADPLVFYYPSNYNTQPLLIRRTIVLPSGPDRETIEADFSRPPTDCRPGDWGKVLTLGSDPHWMSGGPRKIVGLKCGDTKFLYSIRERKVLAVDSKPGVVAPWVGRSEQVVYRSEDGEVEDLGFRHLRRFTFDSAEYRTHSALAHVRAGGYDVYNAVLFDSTPNGMLVRHRLDTGEVKVVIGPATGWPYPPSGTHISLGAAKAPEWVAVSGIGYKADGQAVLDNELLLANVETGEVCRIAHVRTKEEHGGLDYWGEPHPAISPEGYRVLFGSDWGGTTVDTFVVDLRAAR